MSLMHHGLTPFAVSVVPNRHEVAVAVDGEVDMATAGEVAEAVEDLRASGFDEIVVDLRDVTFIDSAGLRMLIALRNDALRTGYRLTLLPARPGAQRIFRLTGTQGLFAWRGRFLAAQAETRSSASGERAPIDP